MTDNPAGMVLTSAVVTFLIENGYSARPGYPSLFTHAFQPNLQVRLDVEAHHVHLYFLADDWTRDGADGLAEMLVDHFT